MSPISDIIEGWHRWDSDWAPAEHELDSLLNWPSGTVESLQKAFKLRLPRSVGWDIREHPHKSALNAAARVYRRGVTSNIDQKVPTSSGSYAICFLHELDQAIQSFSDSLIIIDSKLLEFVRLPRNCNAIPIDINETRKDLYTVSEIRNKIRSSRFASVKEWTIVGGGVLGDLAAFCAALEDKDFRFIPTTLLSMIDACIGGKTGVNFFEAGKNQIGLFAFPKEVLICPDWLNFLPKRELMAGLSEAFKHALIKGDKNLARIAANGQRSFHEFIVHLPDYIKVKSEIVKIDPNELGLRTVLNLGHTLGHAIERVSHQNKDLIIHHGEAVGVGLLFSNFLSRELGHMSEETFHEIQTLLLNSDFLISHSELKRYVQRTDLNESEFVDQLISGVVQDKKMGAGRDTKWVLLKDWGIFVGKQDNSYLLDVPSENLKIILQKFFQNWQQTLSE